MAGQLSILRRRSLPLALVLALVPCPATTLRASEAVALYNPPHWKEYVVHYVAAEPQMTKRVRDQFDRVARSLGLSARLREVLSKPLPSQELLAVPVNWVFYIAVHEPVVYVGVTAMGAIDEANTFVCASVLADEVLKFYPVQLMEWINCVPFVRQDDTLDYSIDEDFWPTPLDEQ